ncbi:hypothetical protein GF342_01490 [Candidatus Woesearchaeota archaeon]|nr:hypothetical protein [Candidatus Woesearchaeota archaeon]
MDFAAHKKALLDRTDHSTKASLDEPIQPLVEYLNAQEEYVTTSSCSGRLVLLASKQFEKKNSKWLFVSHDPVTTTLASYLNKAPDLWYVAEGAILHVKCRDNNAAHAFLSAAKAAGFKRAGIISLKKPLVIELISSERIIAPLVENSTILVTPSYLNTLVRLGNTLLKQTHTKLSQLLTILQAHTQETQSP